MFTFFKEVFNGNRNFLCSVFCNLVPHLPFGGVGESGIGKYTGKASFEIFSHQKSYMYKNQKMESVNG